MDSLRMYTYHTGVSSGIADVSDMEENVCLVHLVCHEPCCVESRLLGFDLLFTVIDLTITHVCRKCECLCVCVCGGGIASFPGLSLRLLSLAV